MVDDFHQIVIRSNHIPLDNAFAFRGVGKPLADEFLNFLIGARHLSVYVEQEDFDFLWLVCHVVVAGVGELWGICDCFVANEGTEDCDCQDY